MIKALLFDWGNTIMVDFNLPGPMCDWDRVAWVEGAESALRQLNGKFPCYVASNAPQSDNVKVKQALAKVGADIYFVRIFSSFDIGFEKPDKRFFKEIITELNLEPENLVMIGDSYPKDIEGAKSCGIRTVFLHKGEEDVAFPSADIKIKSMEQLPEAIYRLDY